ncbi:MAG: hypothetical protein EOP84_00950 [Verrucomicrobiaceae bacterium]|nr:MAG: hypothetical protein EOP84_00950 [Verrucomicrobiaceae bacterium]
MESPVQSSHLRVRYCLRSIFSPLLLAGCMAQLSGSLPAACLILLTGIFVAVLIVVRPYLEITDGEAFQIGLLTGGRRPVEDLEDLLSVKGLRWFLRRTDLEQALRFQSGTVSQRVGSVGGSALGA